MQRRPCARYLRGEINATTAARAVATGLPWRRGHPDGSGVRAASATEAGKDADAMSDASARAVSRIWRYSWSPMSVIGSPVTVVGPPVSVIWPPGASDLETCRELDAILAAEPSA